MKSIVQAAGVCSFTRNGCGARVSGRAALGGSCAAGERRSRSTKIRSHHEALGGSALLGLFGPRWLVGGWCKNGMDGCDDDEEPEPEPPPASDDSESPSPTHSGTHHVDHDDTVRDIYEIGVQKNGF